MSATLKCLSAALVLALATGCHPSPRLVPARGPVHVVLVATTDLHGWFEGADQAEKDGTQVRLGGQALIAGYLANLRAADPGRVVLLDSGDLFQGTMASNLAEGEPVVVGANALGYAAVAVGNHEFDYGPIGERVIALEPGDDPLGALKRNVAAAHFPFLSANITEKATGKPPAWLRRSLLLTVAGVRLGIIGLTTPHTPDATLAANVESLSFGDPIAATIAEARTLRQQGADAVIAIAHIGAICKDTTPDDLASCDADAESLPLVRALPAGTIDAFFGGHTHQPLRKIVAGIPIVQAPPFGRGLAIVDLWVDPQTHHAVPERTQSRPLVWTCAQVFRGTGDCNPKQAPDGATDLVPAEVAGRPVVADASLAAQLAPFLERVAGLRNRPLGFRIAAEFTRDYHLESALGDLISDAIRDAIPGADFGMINSGGLRANLKPGDAIYDHIYQVMPFDNRAATIRLTGAQLREVLRVGMAGEGVLQVSGMKVVLDMARDRDRPKPEKDRIVSVTLADGSPLMPEREYLMATSDFLVTGGEGLGPVLDRLPKGSIHVVYERPALRDLLVSSLQRRAAEHGPLTPALDGRISVLNPPGGRGED